MSFLEHHKVIRYTKFEHFGIIRFWVVLQMLVWKMQLLTLWPCPLTFQRVITSAQYIILDKYMQIKCFTYVNFLLISVQYLSTTLNISHYKISKFPWGIPHPR